MSYKPLYIFVEGDDDEKFFENIVKPILEEKYDWVLVWPYTQRKKQIVRNFLRSVKAIPADYIYVSDIDDQPCITAKKETIQNDFGNIDNNRIIVVVREIESWYLSGLDDICCTKLGFPPYSSTDNISKEQFNDSIPQRFDSRIDLMQEILKYFDLETAKQKNASLRYFLEKHDCEV